MKAAVLYGPGNLSIEQLKSPRIGKNDVLVRTRVCGICTHDVRLFKGLGSITYPKVLGHEVAGVVADVGNRVKKVKCGDKVAVDPARRCGTCFYCVKGLNNLCLNQFWPYGGLAEYISAPEVNVHVFANADFEVASFVEPIACCLNGLLKARLEPGSDVAVVGDGPIGLIHLQLAYHLGASRVIVVGHRDDRLRLAYRFGAYDAVNSLQEDASSRLRRHFNNLGADTVIIAAGTPSAVAQGLLLSRKGGSVVIFAGIYPRQEIAIDSHFLHYSEINIVGSSGYTPYGFLRATRLVDESVLKFGKLGELITHRFSIDETREAIEVKDTCKGMRVVVNL